MEAGDAGPLAITDVTLSTGETQAPAATARTVDVKEATATGAR
ncbi:putative protein OS=Streptomyces microflavus OX=1919 GN=Smic_03700 PE=4 SV=1 [Streptomyces microflavus]